MPSRHRRYGNIPAQRLLDDELLLLNSPIPPLASASLNRPILRLHRRPPLALRFTAGYKMSFYTLPLYVQTAMSTRLPHLAPRYRSSRTRTWPVIPSTV